MELNRAVVQRDRADQDASRIRSFLQNIVDSMPSMMMGTDEEGRITHWNLEAERVSGIDEHNAKGKPLAEVLPMLATQMEKVKAAVRDRVSQRVPRHVSFQGNEKRYSDIMIYPLTMDGASGAVIRIDDVTDRIQVEEMMVQTEKMVSIGGLAAGMAHEINNPLGGILQGLQNVFRRLSPELDKNLQVARACGVDLPSIRNYLERRQILQFLEGMEDAGRRAANIVANMLQFSRHSDAEKQPCSLNGILDRAVELASIDYDLKKRYDFRHVEVVKDYATDLPPLYCIASEIEQVILNLLRNAAQAMNESKGQERPSRIVLRSKREGGNEIIEVEDNGPGMSEAVRSRVMEPFFTTKPVGLGTGLGLSVSYFIVKDGHGGEMTVESVPEKGSLFTIILPIESSV
jgi:PAS domain S-box-containing protein